MQTQDERLSRYANDGIGNMVKAGDVLQGYGLANAGRYITIVEVGKTAGRALVERHIDGKRFWTFLRYYRKGE